MIFIESMCLEFMKTHGYTDGLTSLVKKLLIGLFPQKQRKIAKIVKLEVEGWLNHIAHRPYEVTSIPRLDFPKLSEIYQ